MGLIQYCHPISSNCISPPANHFPFRAPLKPSQPCYAPGVKSFLAGQQALHRKAHSECVVRGPNLVDADLSEALEALRAVTIRTLATRDLEIDFVTLTGVWVTPGSLLKCGPQSDAARSPLRSIIREHRLNRSDAGFYSTSLESPPDPLNSSAARARWETRPSRPQRLLFTQAVLRPNADPSRDQRQRFNSRILPRTISSAACPSHSPRRTTQSNPYPATIAN